MDFSKLSNSQRRFVEDHLYGYTDTRYQCVRAWFIDIEKVAKVIHLVNDSVLLQLAIRNLLDESKQWYTQNQHQLTTWSDFKREMISRFDKGSNSHNINDLSQSKTVMRERRRNIVWHPQHIAYYRLYHSTTSSSTNHNKNFSLPSTSFFELEPSQNLWCDGTESWHIHEIKPQRESFARTQSVMMLVPPSHRNYSIEHNAEQPLTVSVVNLSHTSTYSSIQLNDPRWHVHEAPSQNQSFVHTSSSEKVNNVPEITHFLEHQPSKCILKSKLHNNRSGLIMKTKKSRYAHFLRFWKNVCLSLFLSIWIFGTPSKDFGHYSINNLLSSIHDFHVSNWILFIKTFFVSQFKSLFVYLNPFIKTIATLRTLESLLLYPTTC
ncbi:unnamed protein product [Adineta ricciae]|uniref:Uncharacterized protein n=1 Tax=Adineta ricciae TaxID=249248 RepID=A0A814RRS8_ADIRI|nr:unnamed protein product [Adineta ricciae]